jgi:hypothetical protein
MKTLDSCKTLLPGAKVGCGFGAFRACLLDSEADEHGAGLGLISSIFLFGDVHGVSSLSFGKMGTKGLRLSVNKY